MTFPDWLDDRTGIRRIVYDLLYEPIPGGARWGYVWGGTLVFLFSLQIATGLLLMTVYSPSVTTAWASVWYIQTQVPYGWLIRGLHHFASDAMLIVLAVQCLHMVADRAYRPPRELIWWLTLCLLGLTLVLSLSGHLLPWDQAGYWGTKVRTSILAQTPLLGDAVRRVLIGGSEFGSLTLARFHALHVLVLPTLLVLLVGWRACLGRRCRRTHEAADAQLRHDPYYPNQLARDTLACGVVFAAVVGVLLYARNVLGSDLLEAPADPTASDYPARPEWHTLFLFQWLKHFSGHTAEVVGAIVVPGLVTTVFLLFPFVDRLTRPHVAHTCASAITGVVLLGVACLSLSAVYEDRDPPDEKVKAARAKQILGETLSETDQAVLRAREFNRRRVRADRVARRALILASEQGIPSQGAFELLANDPMARGPELFAGNCSSCHRYDGHDGLGHVPLEPATSSDLAGYASRAWIRGLLKDPMDDRYFGRMAKPDGEPAHTRMAKVIRDLMERNEDGEDRRTLLSDLDAVAAYLEDESLHPGRLAHIQRATGAADVDTTTPGGESPDDELVLRGRRVFLTVCNECHSYNGERDGTFYAPEMLGYGSVEWIELTIADPSHPTRYRSRGREPAQMPGFRDRLTEQERRMLAEWLHATRTTDSSS